MQDETLEIQGVRIATDATCQVVYHSKSTDLLPMMNDTNIYIAVATTAWARMKLYKELDKLGERTLYCDTDSVIYKQSVNPSENLEIGGFLGQMTNELDEGDCIADFVSGGPKCYGYLTEKGKVCVKVKGFTLNAVNGSAFSFENIKKVILDAVRFGDDVEDEPDVSLGSMVKRKKIVPFRKRAMNVENQRKEFLDVHVRAGDEATALAGDAGISVYNPKRIFRSRDWKMFQKPEQKLFSFCFDKRIVLSDLNTVPYGYVGDLG